MQQQNLSHYFQLLERRRLKVAQIHRTRRQEIFNKARQMIQEQEDNNTQTNLQINTISKQNNINKQQYEQQSEINIYNDNSGELIFVQENQVNKNIQEIYEKQTNKNQQINQQTKQQNLMVQQQDKSNKRNKYKNNTKKQSTKYAKMMQTPSWMNVVPQQFHNFYGMARPNGKICFLVFRQNWIYLYDKIGRKLSTNKITSKNPSQIKKLSQYYQGTILQVVETLNINNQQQIYYITDLIYWKHTIMSAQNFDFRYSWVIANIGNLINNKIQGLNIKLIQYLQMNCKQNLQKIYIGNFGYQKQGLLFIHKQSPYINGFNQNVMIWKDYHTSKYPIDEQIKNTQNEKQNVKQNGNQNQNYIYGTGKLRKNGDIYSLDGFKLSHMNPLILSNNFGGYIRYRITSIQFNHKTQQNHGNSMSMQMQDQNQNSNSKLNIQQTRIKLNNFEVIQFKRYGKAQPLSRIIFQYRMRNDPLTIQEIASKINNN